MCVSLAVRCKLAQVSLRFSVSYRFYDNHVLNAVINKGKEETSDLQNIPSSSQLYVHAARMYTGSRLYGRSSSRDGTVDGNTVPFRRSAIQQRYSDLDRLTFELHRLHTIRHEKQVGFL